MLHGGVAVCTCGGESRAPSPSLCDKVMLSPAVPGVWTGCCRYDSAAGDFMCEQRRNSHNKDLNLSFQVNIVIDFALFII